MKGVVYKDVRLMPGSHALELWQAQDWKALDTHMKTIHEAAVARGEVRA